MQVLIIGAGAREHAIAAALQRDPGVTSLACAPGNAGIAAICEVHPLDVSDADAVAALAQQLGADLVVVGPEVPLVAGAADAVRALGIDCFGPSAAAAHLEGSKTFAKEVMASAGIPTARAFSCTTLPEVERALDEFGPTYVVKDDGLAAGKGVVVTDDRDAAVRHATGCLEAGSAVVIEEFLDGPEVSLFCITDGETVVPLIPAQDFKRVGDNDEGPNTGGMGAYAPLPWAPPTLVDEVVRDIALPAVQEMARRGTPYSGVLYVGLALTSKGTGVVEFNARFGDPETQSVLALLQSPFGVLLRAASRGELEALPPLQWAAGAAVTVVLAAAGYPASPRTGDPIDIPATLTDRAMILHAGTKTVDGAIVSSGGRVLSVVGLGADLSEARAAAYEQIARIRLDGSHYRTDIALKATSEA
ncbi:phosphoribosylamine--glycine ligase [Antricoccus suffuscus]|uniref:Phosphoribosylamine--glycine ligase n=1 Tax=Antricoccus suffuscus TaxID=1629062 RepID=A0A2T1A1T6_9ACTN|nr:phosphoribosylamine--glycine ligase [Antricoccus suffuscus]PRZ42565.1 phosphoribosylamine--glycine ligase [Antricoccus suffuscus]